MWWKTIRKPHCEGCVKKAKLKISPKTFTAYKIPPKEIEEKGNCNTKLEEAIAYLKTVDHVELELTQEILSIAPELPNAQLTYKPMPEPVACKIIEYFKESYSWASQITEFSGGDFIAEQLTSTGLETGAHPTEKGVWGVSAYVSVLDKEALDEWEGKVVKYEVMITCESAGTRHLWLSLTTNEDDVFKKFKSILL
jgi:hypothetical protein